MAGAPPDPRRQHRLDGHAHEKVEREERKGLRPQQAERQDAEVVSILAEDEAVEQHEAETGAGQADAEGQDHPRPRDQQDHRNQQHEEREVGERRQMGHVGENGEEPADPGRDRGIVPEIAKTHDRQERRIGHGEPTRPA